MKIKSEGLLYGATVQRKKGSQLQLLDLPLDVLCSIISRLPIRDAIRTSILSSQWRYVWRHHTNNLTFNCFRLKRGGVAVDEQEFIATVDGVLQLHSGTGVDVMEFRCYLHNKHADHIDRWIEFAIMSKAKDLMLHLSSMSRTSLSRNMPYELPAGTPEPYGFPCHLFGASEGCSYLQCLQLVSVSLKLPVDFNGFPILRKLSMVDVNITNEHAEYLLSKCKFLEFLEIACCRMLTSLRALCPLDRLKHLKVQDCILVQQIQMNCGLTTLMYSGPVVPLQFATTSSLRNVCVRLTSGTSALDYVTTGFPSTLQHLETLNLQCNEHKRAISHVSPLKFIYLRRLRLELNIFGDNEGSKTDDVLDYACLLDYAPLLEKLELHMWMRCRHESYRAEHGELRILPRHQHKHLKTVDITGFFGHKDQVELALHILVSSTVLKAMRIDSRVKIITPAPYAAPEIYWRRHYLDGYVIATVFVQGADRNNVVQVAGATKVGRAGFLSLPEL